MSAMNLRVAGPRLAHAASQGTSLRSRRRYAPPSRHVSTVRPVRAALEDVVTMGDGRVEGEGSANREGGSVPPAEMDAQRFDLHWSVEFWRQFSAREALQDVMDEESPVSARLAAAQETLTSALTASNALASTDAFRFWAYHLVRSGFFSAQAIFGLSYARSAAERDSRSTETLTRMEAIAKSGWQGPLAEACLSYYQDFENIKAGKYGMPWDMNLNHRQFNPLYIARKAAAFVAEATDTLRRREEGRAEDVWIKSMGVPDYFKTFHYQSDGWMSSRSAQVYESSTETLFVGRQDAMQRTTLLLMEEALRGKDPSQVAALEVACGTGRFATFVKDAYPTMDLTLTDLSPFYLQEARENMKYWKRMRAPTLSLPGVDGNGTTFLQTKAEELDVADESMDVVYSVYLFHELPPDVQTAVAKEMARVLKPGGMVIFTDSVQRGDRPSMDDTLGNFGDFNEPFYRAYIERDLGGLFESVGLTCVAKAVNSTTKSLSFTKPQVEPMSVMIDDAGNN
mmetsp:Transcript_8605/g.23334  ORF Transcript_8605/g.23334 Transcript_8605/m.23334 type:complete len:511 (-) Transcript_8605:150-1682(-)